MLRLITTAFAAAFVLATTGLASAADFPKKAAGDPANAYASANSFAGFYVGVHGGYGWSNLDMSTLGMITKDDVMKFGPDSFVVGGQAGYNWQSGRFVPGVEIDFSYLGKKDTVGVTNTTSLAGEIQYMGSARARLGFAVTDVWMFYGTAGVAWGHAAISLTQGKDTLELSNVHYGWAGGGGTEFVLSQHWLLRAEYIHYDLGKSTYVVFPAKMTVDVARAALSFRF